MSHSDAEMRALLADRNRLAARLVAYVEQHPLEIEPTDRWWAYMPGGVVRRFATRPEAIACVLGETMP